MSSKRILSVDEDSDSSTNVANSDSIDILNSDSDSSDILLPVRERWKPLVVEDGNDDEDRSNHRQTGDKYDQSLSDNAYKVSMKLTILSVEMSDYGTYKCISKNSLGETDGSIKLYHIPTPTTQPQTTTTTPTPTIEEVENIQNSRQRPLPSVEPSPQEITDSSLPNVARNEDIRLHGRASSGGYSDAENAVATKGRKSVDGEVRPRRIDNTAQSMSSRGSSANFLLQSRTAICIILLSALS